MKNKRLFVIFAAIALILFVPLLGMRFSNSVAWTATDFVVMGMLLLGTGLLCELILRTSKPLPMRLFCCGVVLLLFALIWAEMAVGVFGTLLAKR
jgi:hypothetical protein